MVRRETPVEARREATPARAPVATVEESVSPAIAEGIEKAVEAEKGKKTDRRFRNQKMVIEELGNTTRIPEAGRTADVSMQPKPTPAPERTRGSSPVIQVADDVAMEPLGGTEEIKYTKASMRRMRKKGTFPEPYGNPLTYNPNANPASSNDPGGSSASADYQRRLREGELLRLEKERLVTQQLESDKKEATRGRSKTVKKKKETETKEENKPESAMEVIDVNDDDGRQRSRSKQGRRRGKEMETDAEKPKPKRPTSEEASQKPKKSKVSQLELPEPMTKAEKKEAKKRQQEEQKAEEKQDKRRKPTAKEESKVQYFQIDDVVDRKTKEEKKKEKAKAQKAEEPQVEQQQEEKGPKKIDTKKTKSYWEKKSNAYILDQLSLHGVRIDPSLLSGRKKVFDVVKDKEVIEKVKKITKAELLAMLYKELKML